MEKLLELSDITLIPYPTNNGRVENAIYTVKDELDDCMGNVISETLPIFTSPMESIVGINSCEIWAKNKIRPIIPRTESIQDRLRWCAWVFSSFSLTEINRYFVDQIRKDIGPRLHIYIDCDNGHNLGILNACYTLKNIYGDQVVIMGGNVNNPETYDLYSEAKFDYIRVGSSSSSDKKECGFHYPLATLLIKIMAKKAPDLNGNPPKLRPVKVVADGEISNYSDIMKALALGADYVMIGEDFSRIIEAEGLIYVRAKNPNTGEYEMNEINNQKEYYGSPGYRAKCNGFCRPFHRNYSGGDRNNISSNKKPGINVDSSNWSWVDVDKSLEEWISEFEDCAKTGFMYSNSKNWIEFRKNTLYNMI